MAKKARERIYQIVEVASPDDLTSRVFDIFIMTLIFLNVTVVMLETVESISSRYTSLFWSFEVFSVSVFSLEYLLRVWTCTLNERFKRPLVGRIRFALTPLLLIDIIAILPFYLPMFMDIDLRFVRAMRLFRIFRLFKMARYSESMKMVGNVLSRKKEELIVTISVVLLLLITASSMMYLFEKGAQPEKFTSIPAAMWWGVATLTTVGYGDLYPVTALGKLIGALIAILGVGMFALPAGILGSGFVDEMQRRREEEKPVCPHCGKRIDEPRNGS